MLDRVPFSALADKMKAIIWIFQPVWPRLKFRPVSETSLAFSARAETFVISQNNNNIETSDSSRFY